MIEVTTTEFIAISFLLFFVTLSCILLSIEFFKIRHVTESSNKCREFFCKRCNYRFFRRNSFESTAQCPKCKGYCIQIKNKRF